MAVQDKALDHVFLEPFCGPAAELDSPVTPHPVAYGQNHIEVTEFYQSPYLADALGLNYPEFPDSCLRALLMIAVDVDDMLADGAHRHLV